MYAFGRPRERSLNTINKNKAYSVEKLKSCKSYIPYLKVENLSLSFYPVARDDGQMSPLHLPLLFTLHLKPL